VPAARRLLGEAALIGLSITDEAQLKAPDVALASGTVMTLPPRSVVVMSADVPTRRSPASRKRSAS